MAFPGQGGGGGNARMFRDPIASRAGTGLSGMNGGLGFIAAVIAAIPSVVNAIESVMHASSKGAAVSDPVAAVWQAIPATQINAHVGSDGWWYDNTDNHQLSHEEAAQRQQQLVAATIEANVAGDGWWVDSVDGHQLSHAEAWQRYQALAAGQPIPRTAAPSVPYAPTSTSPLFWSPTTPYGSTVGYQPKQTAGMFGNVSPTMMLVIGAAIIGAVVLSGKRTNT